MGYRWMRWGSLAAAGAFCVAMAACGSDDDDGRAGGTAGATGSGGETGVGGSATATGGSATGTGGSAGSGGSGGSAGTTGVGGEAGSTGQAGAAGSGQGGSGPTEFITVSVEGGPADTVIGAFPAPVASYNNVEQGPFPASSMAVAAGDFGGGHVAIVTFAGTTPGSYDVAAGEASVLYSDASGQMYATVGLGLDSGTVTVTAVGAIGEPVEGSFDVVAREFGQDGPTTTTVTLTGTFAAIREADDFMSGAGGSAGAPP